MTEKHAANGQTLKSIKRASRNHLILFTRKDRTAKRGRRRRKRDHFVHQSNTRRHKLTVRTLALFRLAAVLVISPLRLLLLRNHLVHWSVPLWTRRRNGQSCTGNAFPASVTSTINEDRILLRKRVKNAAPVFLSKSVQGLGGRVEQMDRKSLKIACGCHFLFT